MTKYLAVLIFAGFAAATPVFTVGSSFDAEAVGSLIEVDVTVFGLSDTLASYCFDLGFNPAVLQPVGSPGVVDGSSIAGIAREDVNLNYGGRILKLYFLTVGRGTSFLAASNVVLTDTQRNEILCTVVGGMIAVDGPAPPPASVPEPRTFGLAALGLAGLLARRLAR